MIASVAPQTLPASLPMLSCPMHPNSALPAQTSSVFHSGGGEMGARIRCFDWTANPLGPLAEWSAALRVTVDMALSVAFSDLPVLWA